MSSVVVAGSANMDTAVHVRQHPHPGETVLGAPLGIGAGGKGLNQAIAAARAGADTIFVGAVGEDAAAAGIHVALESAGVRPAVAVSDQPTGSAFVMVSPAGENAIVVVPGANADATALSAHFSSRLTELGPGDVLLTQLEIPTEVVIDAHRTARERGAVTMLNAAPSRPLPTELIDATDILIVNEHECVDIAGGDYADTADAALVLAERVPHVVVTLGASGALIAAGGSIQRFDAHPVVVVDTTAAGDTFCGAVAGEIVAGVDLPSAVAFGMAAAALTVQNPGAAGSIPTREQTLKFLEQRSADVPTLSGEGASE